MFPSRKQTRTYLAEHIHEYAGSLANRALDDCQVPAAHPRSMRVFRVRVLVIEI